MNSLREDYDVYILFLTQWIELSIDANGENLVISDEKFPGSFPEGAAIRPDGTVRPFVVPWLNTWQQIMMTEWRLPLPEEMQNIISTTTLLLQDFMKREHSIAELLHRINLTWTTFSWLRLPQGIHSL